MCWRALVLSDQEDCKQPATSLANLNLLVETLPISFPSIIFDSLLHIIMNGVKYDVNASHFLPIIYTWCVV